VDGRSRIFEIAPVPEARQYAAALAAGRPDVAVRTMLCAHRRADERTLTAAEIAAVVGRSYRFTNRHYGALGGRIATFLGLVPDIYRNGPALLKTTAIARGWRRERGPWYWQLYPEVAAALDELGWTER